MCGIAAIVQLDNRAPPAGALRKLSDAMHHRGPDDDGLFVHGNVGLVFRRLSIIDLSRAGHQPMQSTSGRFVVVFNGEIFNYIELRAELERLGHKFVSTSDTEVLLNAYIEWNVGCLERLNGMWAFIVLDKETGKCFCARDRFGIKPLYCMQTSKFMIFASEVSAILSSGLYNGRPDSSTVAKYLFSGDLDSSGATFHQGISAVAPGNWMTVDSSGRVRSGEYWELPEDTEGTPDYDELYDLFSDSVKLRLRSDVPLGVFLSGGMDSSSILCAAARHLGADRPIRAYSFMAPEYDETRYINDTLAQTGATLIPLEMEAEGLWNELMHMTEHQDGPVHTPSALIGFCLCKLAARQGTKVILNGQGADETLAGYSNYFMSHWQSLLREAQFRTMLKQLRGYSAQHRVGVLSLLYRVIMRFAKVQLDRMPTFQRVTAVRHRREFRSHPFYTTELADCLQAVEPRAGNGGLGEALRRSVTRSPLPLYLRVEDRNSMAHSIEVRLPFLDYRLVNTVMRIAATCKLDGFWNKILLRDAMRGRIPESVRTRPDKMGFATPDAKWIKSWAPQIEAIFRSRTFAERGFFNVPNLLAALKDHVNGVREHHEDIFRAVQVEQYLSIAAHRAEEVSDQARSVLRGRSESRLDA